MNKNIWGREFPGAYWIDKSEERAMLDVLRNGSLFRYYGLKAPRYVDAYEKAACDFYGTDYALAINSGTGALIASMRAFGIGPGCEVILPAFLWVATVGAVVQCGAIPVLCEIDDSFTMDPKDLERKITARTRLIVPIHMTGAPSNMAAIMAIARRRKIPVLEDCAQCNGGRYRGCPVGTFGAMGIFSLQLNKNMTCGEGGLIVTSDKRLFNRAFAAHDMGMIRVDGRLAMPDSDSIMWGEGRRMTEICGAIACQQLRKLTAIVTHMRASKQRIKDWLGSIPGVAFRRLHDEKGDTGAFLTLILDDPKRAAEMVPRLAAAGITNASYAGAYGLHLYYNIPALTKKIPLSAAGDPWRLPQNAKSHYRYTKGTCPVSDDLFARSIIIPIPSRLTQAQEKAAAAAMRKILAG